MSHIQNDISRDRYVENLIEKHGIEEKDLDMLMTDEQWLFNIPDYEDTQEDFSGAENNGDR